MSGLGTYTPAHDHIHTPGSSGITLIVDRRMKDLIYSEVPATRLPVAFG